MEQWVFEKHDRIGLLKVNRPDNLNALNQSVLHELKTFLEWAARKHNTQVMILTGSGEKAFIAGADIKEMKELNPAQAVEFCRLGQEASLALENAPFITIAAVNGYALGGGLEMALACDFIYASSKAVLGLPEVSLGLIPGFGGTHRLARSVGTRMAKELIFSGRKIGAEEALRLGLINRICDPETLLEQCLSTAQEILRCSVAAALKAKRALNHGFHLPVDEALQRERTLFQSCFEEKDAQEGLAAFLEKRAAKFPSSLDSRHAVEERR